MTIEELKKLVDDVKLKEKSYGMDFVVCVCANKLRAQKKRHDMEDGLAVVNTAVQGIIPALAGQSKNSTAIAVELIETLKKSYWDAQKRPSETLSVASLLTVYLWLNSHKEEMASWIDEA